MESNKGHNGDKSLDLVAGGIVDAIRWAPLRWGPQADVRCITACTPPLPRGRQIHKCIPTAMLEAPATASHSDLQVLL